MSETEIGMIILAVFFIGLIIFGFSCGLIGILVSDVLENRYREEWEREHKEELARCAEIQEEIKALQPKVMLLRETKKKIDTVTEQRRYVADTSPYDNTLHCLKLLAEELMKDEARFDELISENNEIAEQEYNYIKSKLPKWLRNF